MMKHLLRYNESLRDKMTPKSREEIVDSLSGLSAYNKIKMGTIHNFPEIVEQGFKEIDKKSFKNSDILHYIETAINNQNVEIVKLFLDNGDIEYPLNSYLLNMIQKYQNLDMVKLFHEYGADLDYLLNFSNIIDRYITTSDKPVDLIRYLIDNSLKIRAYVIEKYKHYDKLRKFYGIYIDGKVTESIKDKMTPKSDSEVAQTLLKKYGVKTEISEFLNKHGYRFAQAHDTAWKDRWRITIRFQNESKGRNFYFLPSDSLEKVKSKFSYTKFNEGVRYKMTPKSEREINSQIEDKIKYGGCSGWEYAKYWVNGNDETKAMIEDRYPNREKNTLRKLIKLYVESEKVDCDYKSFPLFKDRNF